MQLGVDRPIDALGTWTGRFSADIQDVGSVRQHLAACRHSIGHIVEPTAIDLPEDAVDVAAGEA